ncbi:hypothetical protein [Methylobrevis pamukkalensis]|uniref:Uncharacterized protein n=1 Tax=Methylobrevis pamukkalensis TaxID=1439726 RepID=A0A1E3GYH8_9HYPH|nr:hypothetical protein [Methylobrevis pamukkalensis]ODN69084.1 hypothetical protein A6302_03622 [Methylobrevis pamukkalensis]
MRAAPPLSPKKPNVISVLKEIRDDIDHAVLSAYGWDDPVPAIVGKPAPTPAEAIASVFDGRNTPTRRRRVREVLETLVATGLARLGEDGRERRCFLPR